MSSSMRVLTWNVQMRSALMEMGFPPSIPPVYSAPERAEQVARAILTSRDEIDVVCLNEVFDEPARGVLAAELEGEFPYQVSKADVFFRRVAMPGLLDDIGQDVWELVFDPIADLTGIGMLKFEDSGLFLASRLPFETVPPPPEALPFFPTGVPVVRFLMYELASGDDAFAAKGVLYARLQQPWSGVRHVFLSHMQADYERVGQHAVARGFQMRLVADFVEQCVEQRPPFGEEVVFCGDLNVVGHGALDTQASEWRTLFADPGGPFTGILVDRWGDDQCPGAESGRTDPGFTADVVYPPFRQRLDYFFTSATSGLAVQHLRVAHDLADPNGLPFLSDHFPLLADCNEPTPNCTPATALRVHDDPPLLSEPSDTLHEDSLIHGMVRWYRFDVAGTYDIALDVLGADTAYEVYLGDDFSSPQAPYREIEDPERGTRFVLLAPFFVKVFLLERTSESSFTLRTHRHDGQSLDDAIVLVPGVEHREHFPAQTFNNDTTVADWDDSESKWFLVETPRLPLSRPLELSVRAHESYEHQVDGNQPTPILVSLGRWDGTSPEVTLADQTAGGEQPQELEWQAGEHEHYVVLVQRLEAPNSVVEFRILLETSLTLLVARPVPDTSLTCQKETSGWGADDIRLELRADAELVALLSNQQIGDFEGGSVRQVGDKLPELIPYVESLEVTVVEEDDIGRDDIGRGRLPVIRNLVPSPSLTVLPPGLDGRTRCVLTIGVDDGRYAFACVLSRWHPSA